MPILQKALTFKKLTAENKMDIIISKGEIAVMSISIPTPHIEAKQGDFAKTVLMPGDPLRAEYIAKTYLTDLKQVNSVRGILGFTGKYNGVAVSVMASGMGIPSISIYAHELFNGYGVENIIRVGTAGALNDKLKIGDIVVGMGACTNSAVINQYGLSGFAPITDYRLLKTLCKVAEDLKIKVNVGNIFSNDLFYNPDLDFADKWSKLGVLAVEMEAAGLYFEATLSGKKALAICSISDSLITGETTTSEQRQKNFNDMMVLALQTAVNLEK